MRRNGDATGVLAAAVRRARDRPRSSISTNEVFDGDATDGRGYAPDDRAAPGNPYGASKLGGRARGDRRPSATPARGTPRDRPDGLAVRAARARLPAQDPRRGRAGAGRRASRSGSSATSGARRPTPPTSPTRSSSCSPRTPIAGIHHLVNGGIATPADWAADVVGAARRRRRRSSDVPASTWQRASSRRAGACSTPTPLPSGEPMRPWPDGDGRLRAGPRCERGARAARPMSLDRAAVGPARASATAPSRATPTSAARSASCGARRVRRDRPGRCRRAPDASPLRPGQPVDLGGRRPARPAPPPAPARPLGRRVRAARSSRSSTSARCSTAGRPRRSSRPASSAADDWVVIPTGVAHGFLALEPLELLYLVTNEYDGSDELGFAWDDPAVARPVAGRRRRRPTGARSCPSATARTRRWPTSWCACATDAGVD